MRIYLIGYMASGKTQIGHILANRLGFSFTDLDTVFEKQFRISVSDFFEKYDEQAFRLLEQKLLLETKNLDNIVISTGGGTPCFFDNMDFIAEPHQESQKETTFTEIWSAGRVRGVGKNTS